LCVHDPILRQETAYVRLSGGRASVRKFSRGASERKTTTLDLAGKAQELQAKFDEEANKYDVYPLDSRISERLDPKAQSGP
jgi:hypothetical protein